MPPSHLTIISLLTTKSVKTIIRSRPTVLLLVCSVVGVLGGLFTIWAISHRQMRQILTSDPYKKLAFDFQCDIANYSALIEGGFLSNGVECVPMTNNTLSLISSLDVLSGHQDEYTSLLNHLSSLMMNGLPLVGLEDYVRLSDFANHYLGRVRSNIMSSPFVHDSFSNLLDVRSKRIVLTESPWSELFHGFLLDHAPAASELITISNTANIDESIWAIIDIHANASGVTIRMPPSAVPDTRNMQWSPLQRALIPQQSGELLYFLSGFLTIQLEFQNFLRVLHFNGSLNGTVNGTAVSSPELFGYHALTDIDVFPIGQEIFTLLEILSAPNGSMALDALNASTLTSMTSVLHFPLYHRAFPTAGYAQVVFWRLFDTVMVLALVLFFSLPAALCMAGYAHEDLEVMHTLGVSRLHSLCAWWMTSTLLVGVFFLCTMLFFMLVLAASDPLLPALTLLLAALCLNPLGALLSILLADGVVLAIPLTAFMLVLPGILYACLAYDVTRTMAFELILTCNPLAGAALVLEGLFRCEALGVRLDWTYTSPTADTPIWALLAVQLLAVLVMHLTAAGIIWLIYKYRTRHVIAGNNYAMRLQGISKAYHTQSGPVETLHGISSILCCNAVTVLLGGNGAGKTTLLRILAGLDSQYTGTVTLCTQIEEDLEQAAAVAAHHPRRLIGWCPQSDTLFDQLTCSEHVLLCNALLGIDESLSPSLQALGLADAAHRPAGMLSGGMKRRLSLLLAMAGRPSILLLDEPTSGCDAHTREAIRSAVLAYSKHSAILLSTHHTDDMEVLADRLWFLNERYLDLDTDVKVLTDRANMKIITEDAEHAQMVRDTVTAWRMAHSTILVQGDEGNAVSITPDEVLHLPDLLSRLRDRSLAYSLEHASLYSVLCDLYPPPPSAPPTQSLVPPSASSPDWLRAVCAMWTLRKLDLRHRARYYLFAQILLPLAVVTAVAYYCSDVRYPGIQLSSSRMEAGLGEVWLAAGPEYSDKGNLTCLLSEDPYLSLLPFLLSPAPLASEDMVVSLASSSSPLPGRHHYGAVVLGDYLPAFLETSVRLPYRNRDLPPAELLAHLQEVQKDMCTPSEVMLMEAEEEDGLLIGRVSFCAPAPRIVLSFWETNASSTPWEVTVRCMRPASSQATLLTNISVDHATPIFLKEVLFPLLNSTVIPYALDSHPLHLPGHVDRPYLERGFLGSVLLLLLALLQAVPSVTVLITLRADGSKRMLHLGGMGLVSYYLANYTYDVLCIALGYIGTFLALYACLNPVHAFYLSISPMRCLALFMGYSVSVVGGNYFLAALSSHALSSQLGIVLATVSAVFAKLFFNRYPAYPLYHAANAFLLAVSPAYALLTGVFHLFHLYTTGLKEGTDREATAINLVLAWMCLQAVVYLSLAMALDAYSVSIAQLIAQARYALSARNMNTFLIQYGFLQGSGAMTQEHSEQLSLEEADDLLRDYRVGVFPHIQKAMLHATEMTPLLPKSPLRGRLLHAEEVCVAYPKAVRLSLADLALSLQPGERLALLGGNGSGKSTFFAACALAQACPASGQLSIAGLDSVQDMWTMGPKHAVGFVPQAGGALPDYLTIREALTLFSALAPADAAVQLPSIVPERYLDYPLGRLSGGTRKKAQLAAAVLARPALLLLDEVSTGVDPVSGREIVHYLASLAEQGSGMVLTSHRVEECAMLCSRVAMLVDGSLALTCSMPTFQALAAGCYQVDVHLLCTLDAFLPALLAMSSPQRVVTYAPDFLRLTLRKASAPLDSIYGALLAWQEQGMVAHFALRAMEMEEVLAALMAEAVNSSPNS